MRHKFAEMALRDLKVVQMVPDDGVGGEQKHGERRRQGRTGASSRAAVVPVDALNAQEEEMGWEEQSDDSSDRR